MRRIITVSIALLLLGGCGPQKTTGTVSGTVTYNNQPVNGATLLLYPAGARADEGKEIPIPVGQDGTFSSSNLPPGEYKIVVQANPGDPGPSTRGMTPEQLAKMKESLDKLKTPATIKYPDKYKQLDRTDLTLTVTPSDQTVNLVLKN
jgi:hypothetical protein